MKLNKLITLTLFVPFMLTGCGNLNPFGITVRVPQNSKAALTEEEVKANLGETYSISFSFGYYENEEEGVKLYEESAIRLMVTTDKIYGSVTNEGSLSESYMKLVDEKWYQYTDTDNDTYFDTETELDEGYQFSSSYFGVLALSGTVVMYDTAVAITYKDRACHEYTGTYSWSGMGTSFSYTQVTIFDDATGICLKSTYSYSGTSEDQFNGGAYLEVTEISTDATAVNNALAEIDARIDIVA